MAMNKLGSSKFMPDLLSARTSSKFHIHTYFLLLDKLPIYFSVISLSLLLTLFSLLTLGKAPPSYSSPSLDEKNFKDFPGFLIIVGTIVGTLLILMNVLLIGCCLHRKTKKRVTGK